VAVRVSYLACVASILAALQLASCSTIDKVRGKEGVASNDAEAVKVKPEDPLSRPIQVAWTSARAKYCGFLFEHAYDYTFDSVTAGIGSDPAYCSKARTEAIRVDLTRYLAGDYTPSARAAR
jgi:hypothetical protein